MIRRALRDLCSVFPLFTVLGAVTICAAGLASFDASLAMIRPSETPAVLSPIEKRAAHRAAAASSVRPSVIKRKIGGKTIKAAPVSRRLLKSSAGSGSTSSRVIQYETARCGDKLIMLAEECNDGNATAGDGCSASCKIETGYSCNQTQPSRCWSTCGDGVIATGKEECDDGNTTNSDGCSQYCRVDPGYECSGSTSECTES